jgi:hypothetical protein
VAEPGQAGGARLTVAALVVIVGAVVAVTVVYGILRLY